MSISSELQIRSELKCELCYSNDDLDAYNVPPKMGNKVEDQVVLCTICLSQVENPEDLDKNHWRCLNESIWNPHPSVQVLSYRLLKRLENEEWAVDLLGMMYMDEDTMEWANHHFDEQKEHRDCNGHRLLAGDTVVLIKDLNVKGANFTAKRGTSVRRISLVQDNLEHIQGKINDQSIIILTKFVKRSGQS